jgi:hypothetical protein
MNTSLLRQLSAWIPVAMSVGALATVAVHVAMFGAAPEVDEGAAAHVWQLLIIGQLPVVMYFALKWIPRAPRRAMGVISLQTAAILMALTPVYWLGL